MRRKTGGNPCGHRVVLAGDPLPAGAPANFLPPMDLAGIEVYHGPATTLLEYRPSGGAFGSACGIVVLWTRYGL